MTTPSHEGSFPLGGQGSPYAEPVWPSYAGPGPSPYAQPVVPSPYAQSFPSPYAESAPSPYAQPVPSPYAQPVVPSPYAEPVPSPYAEPVQSPYAGPGRSPYAEPVRRPDYLRRQRVEIPSSAPPRRWPWVVTGAVSLLVIAIAVAVMFKNLGDQTGVKPKANQVPSSVSGLPQTSTSPSQSGSLAPGEDTSTTDADSDSADPSADSTDASPTDETVPITTQSTPTTTTTTTTTKKSSAPEPADDQAKIPSVKGRNAEQVRQQLAGLGFTNIQLVPDNPANGWVLWAPSWNAVSVDPGPGKIVDLTDQVTVRCAPIQN